MNGLITTTLRYKDSDIKLALRANHAKANVKSLLGRDPNLLFLEVGLLLTCAVGTVYVILSLLSELEKARN